MDSFSILKILTLLIGFYMAWNIGSNDVSNAMGTSVGSKALTLTKAVLLAAVLEFFGAFFLGSHVSQTIQSGILIPETFESNASIFVLGMLGSLFATGIWLNLASYLRLPVSTTHAIVGSIAGFGLMIGGIDSIQWEVIFFIVLSWVVSPILSGVVAFIIFTLIQKKIFYTLNPIDASKRLIPIFVFFVFSVFTMSLLYNGIEKFHLDLSFSYSLAIALLVGFVAFIIVFFLTRKMTATACHIKRPIHPMQLASLEKAYKYILRTKATSIGEIENKSNQLLKEIASLKKTVKERSDYSQTSSEYHRIEKSFAYLQIFSAALVAFAHGANDIANAIGPVAAIFATLKIHSVDFAPSIPLWILGLGGAGIVIGLATWGWRVIETIGKKITELTPTRGFCAEFSSAIIILLASKMGMPISTTHALVGAILGVGLARGITAINLKTVRDIVLSWIVTIPICMILSILSFYILKLIFY